jgi:hypothetical protein
VISRKRPERTVGKRESIHGGAVSKDRRLERLRHGLIDSRATDV